MVDLSSLTIFSITCWILYRKIITSVCFSAFLVVEMKTSRYRQMILVSLGGKLFLVDPVKSSFSVTRSLQKSRNAENVLSLIGFKDNHDFLRFHQIRKIVQSILLKCSAGISMKHECYHMLYIFSSLYLVELFELASVSATNNSRITVTPPDYRLAVKFYSKNK